MPFNYECTNYPGKICLEVGTTPYQTECGGKIFIGQGANPDHAPNRIDSSCVIAIWGQTDGIWEELDKQSPWYGLTWNELGCYFRDFMIDRGHIISDDDLCPEEQPTYTLLRCINRFGLGYFEEDPSTGVFREFQTDECVGHKTHIINGTQPYHWEYTSEQYIQGVAQNHLDLPEGSCVGGEPSLLYTIKADPSNCNNRLPCAEIRRYSCVLNLAAPTPEDPDCATRFRETLGYTTPSLLEDAFFCAIDPSIANHRRNAWCSTDVSAIRIMPQSANFCEYNDGTLGFRIGDNVPKVRFCDANVDFIRLFVESVSFCSLDTINIRDPLIVQSVYFCSQDISTLLPTPESVGFCSSPTIVNKAQFCALDASTIRPGDAVSFCETVIPLGVTFCSMQRTAINPSLNVSFCSMDRNTVDELAGAIPRVQFCETSRLLIDGADNVGFCSHEFPARVQFCETPRKLIDVATDVTFCETPRKLLDTATDLTFCETPRKLIHNATNVTFCATPRKLIDGAVDVGFCLTDRELIDGATNVSFCSQDDTAI